MEQRPVTDYLTTMQQSDLLDKLTDTDSFHMWKESGGPRDRTWTIDVAYLGGDSDGSYFVASPTRVTFHRAGNSSGDHVYIPDPNGYVFHHVKRLKMQARNDIRDINLKKDASAIRSLLGEK